MHSTLARPRSALKDLWDSAPSPVFIADRRPPYVSHSTLPWTPRATAVHLAMHGEIKLDRWRAFRAEEVIHHRRGFVWKAKVAGGISGVDALVDGAAVSRWKLLGVIPVAKATGEDVTRSAIGRWLCESLWLPTMLRPDDGAEETDGGVILSRLGESAHLRLTYSNGRLERFEMDRWGNPGGGAFAYHRFGGVVEEEREFEGHILPSKMRCGWDHDEFFRVTLDDAQFR